MIRGHAIFAFVSANQGDFQISEEQKAESLITEMSNDDLLKFVSLDLNAAVL